MTLAAAPQIILSYYDFDTGQVQSGVPMKFGHNINFNAYFEPGRMFIDQMKASELLAGADAVPGTIVNGYMDSSTSGSSTNITHSGLPQEMGTYVLKWAGDLSVFWNQGVIAVGNHIIAAQDETDYDNSPVADGIFSGGTGHNVGDVITVQSNATVTVDAEVGNVVTEFTVETSNVPATDNRAKNSNLNQIATTGLGAGFSLQVGAANLLNRIEYLVSEPFVGTGRITATLGLATSIVLVAPGEETRYDAGNIVHSKYLSDVAGIDHLRAMDLMETNSAWLTDPEHLCPYENASWRKQRPEYSPRAWMGAPPQAIAEMCNEIDCDCWINVPPHATDACATAMFDILETHLNAGRKIYVEYMNEPWNAASAFLDSWWWVQLGDVAREKATVDNPTGICALAGHGFTGGELITAFNSATHSSWPWAFSGQSYIDVIDVDTFYISADPNDLSGTRRESASNPLVVTLDFKRNALSVKANSINYADRYLELWALADTAFPTREVVHVAGAWANGVSFMVDQLTVAGVRENYDFFAIAPYFWVTKDVDWFTKSYSELTDIVLTGAYRTITDNYVINHTEALGNYSIIAYEGGDHSLLTDPTTSETDKLLGWQRSSEATRCYNDHFKIMSGLGVNLFCNFNTCNTYNSELGSWGVMEFLNDQTAAQYLGIKPFLTGGGVPKN